MTDKDGLTEYAVSPEPPAQHLAEWLRPAHAGERPQLGACAAPETHHRSRGRIHAACRSQSRISSAGTPRRCRGRRRRVTQVITNNLKRSGLFCADRSGRLYREDRQHRRRAALSRLEADQRAGAGHRPHHAAGRRPAQGRIPPVGRDRRPAAHRPAIFHPAGQLAAHRAHHLRRDLRAPHRREGLFRQPRRVHRRDRSEGAPRQAARA